MIEEKYLSQAEEPKYKIIIVGDPYVGKTALFWKYIEGDGFKDNTTTITTIDFKIQEVIIEGKTVKLYIWDTAGQEKYRAIVSTYFKGCDGVMLVFDLSSFASFTNVTTKWYEISKCKSPNAQLLLVGNKTDLDPDFDEKKACLWAKDHGALYVRTSVKRDINVSECFRRLSEAIYKNPPIEKTNSFTLRKKRSFVADKKRDCC